MIGQLGFGRWGQTADGTMGSDPVTGLPVIPPVATVTVPPRRGWWSRRRGIRFVPWEQKAVQADGTIQAGAKHDPGMIVGAKQWAWTRIIGASVIVLILSSFLRRRK